MGAAIAPVLGSVISAVASAALKPSPPSPPAPVAPPPPPALPEEDKGADPQEALDVEAAKQRALKRRRAAQSTGLSLLNTDTGTTDEKTLTGS